MSNLKEPRRCGRGHWKPDEDAKLKELVAQFGPRHWNLIAEKLHARSGKSCRLRWFNELDPRINRRPFSEEEEEKLVEIHGMHGNKWALISSIFPGRTDNALKNHFHLIMARKRKDHRKFYQRMEKPCSEFKISRETIPLLHLSDGESFGRRSPLYHEFEQQSGNSSAPVIGNTTKFMTDFGGNDGDSEYSVSFSSALLSPEGENMWLNGDSENMTVKRQFIDFLGVDDT